MEQPSFLKKWMIAVRPFAFPASTMSVIFGTVLAVTVGQAHFRPLPFVLAFLGMVLLHAGANILGDVNDFKKGLDKVPTPVSGAVVRGYISTGEALTASIVLLAIGAAIGLLLVYWVGTAVLWIGVAGILIGVFYTVGPIALKYHRLGDLAVFLNFGILGSLGAWTVQTGEPSWVPAVWAIPMSMLVAAILHANNWRDISTDTEGRIGTMASLLGDRLSLPYYGVLVFGAFVCILVIVLLTNLAGLQPVMPYTFVITLLALPLALKLWRKGRLRASPAQPLDFVALDGATAQLNLLFGLLCTGALLLDSLVVHLLR
ncbi:MAG: 1,4-dihydroxy-2-naphthoate octaprenyltransferase [Acidobacteriota bacterium]